MKSLTIVQRIAKVFNVLASIAFVCTIIGAVGALIGGIVVLAVPHFSDNVAKLIVSEAEIANAKDLGVGLIAESVFLAAQAIAFWFVCRYYKNELADGTPFTHRGAKELLKTGILYLAIPLCGLCVSSAVIAIAQVEEVLTMSYEILGGATMILLSFVFHYGADLRDEGEKASKQDAPLSLNDSTLPERSENDSSNV